MIRHIIIVTSCVLIGAFPVLAADAPTDTVGEAALAEHFAQMAHLTLAAQAITPAVWHEATALFKATTRLNPVEPRYWRLLAEAALQDNDQETAMAALQAYARLEPEDQGAQIQIIDLHLGKMQSADERLAYLKVLIDTTGLNEAVRSYAATRATKILYDRSQDSDAQAMLVTALRLNPVNLEALRLNYDRISEQGTTYERASALLAMLRANPAQPDVMARLAGELAAAALPADSIGWYTYAFSTAARMGRALDADVLIDAAAEMLIGDQLRQADQAVAGIQQMDPSNIDGWYLRLLLSKRTGDKDGFAKALEGGTTAMLERLYAAHRAFAGSEPATQPSGELAVRMPDIADDAKKLKASGKEDLIHQYATALTDLAWLQIYFAEQPATAKPIIDALRTLLPADNLTTPRLDGWSFLLLDKPDEAKLKLSAVAERDPLAMMGLIRLNAKSADSQSEQIQLQARTLVNKNASGLLGALLQDGLRELGGRLVAAKDADALRQRLDEFPKAWMTILDKPQSFYGLYAEPLKVSHAFDEPMLGRVTVQNLSDFDLTIGPNGVIHPDLWFDVSIKGPVNQNQSGAIYDRLTKAIVLHKGQSVTQNVRLDSGMLGGRLMQNPVVSVQLYFSVLTNPTSGASKNVIPGPAGYRQTLRRVVDRSGSPIGTAQQQKKIFDALANGTSAEKIRATSLLGAYVAILTNERANPAMRANGKQFEAELNGMMEDPSQPVRAWARYVRAATLPPGEKAAALKRMAEDQYWPVRAIALMLADLTPIDEAKKLAASLLKDPDPLIAELAAAVVDDLAHPATQPTTAPSTAPSTAPTARP